jgi:hypothetical protein
MGKPRSAGSRSNPLTTSPRTSPSASCAASRQSVSPTMLALHRSGRRRATRLRWRGLERCVFQLSTSLPRSPPSGPKPARLESHSPSGQHAPSPAPATPRSAVPCRTRSPTTVAGAREAQRSGPPLRRGLRIVRACRSPPEAEVPRRQLALLSLDRPSSVRGRHVEVMLPPVLDTPHDV